ncbi:MAG: replication-associated recombination protein A [Zhenhengia sp.]|jgi:putative ATPase|uniref:Replication-associated recombination protein A n=1 Tax=Zhenhengia yiwuensis TaxID=2763666 RepID=A0A926ECF0_9FIRM|nr:replication-associated recombination protein A [Zhenhengia yiwuensis]MBP3911316.1 replication-associated recombination protein A [Niameybacter sp.]MBS5316580.1 replication-associated recombination protein A [Clostridiales bacterium]MBC8578411.1 replication-associated recombination protein A [Zhenhengia yiwuensis]MBS5798463.1 replication-associated recombination protein A [Clostridiales bacterium]MDU6361160.1 replication-associated recombination protein A [Clostridiales bacterium]
MDLFDYINESKKNIDSPLASRMRPTKLEDIAGQEHILSPGKLLYRAIKADKLQSLIFYGPPGTGKTTIAKVIANTTKASFTVLNATTSGKQDITDAVKEAKIHQAMTGNKTIIFVDEIHRFNKAQQDALLPYTEDGTIILIGATTENPYFEVNRALISRSLIFELRPLDEKAIRKIIKDAVESKERGLGAYQCKVTEEALDFIALRSGGDARSALNAIELAAMTTERSEDGLIHIDVSVMEECMQKRMLNYDKKGDNHYDVISAFIKSMRGSDKDATLHYLARMIEAGEDPKFIARRITICASEDVGNADPMALIVATNAMLAAERIGMPESRIILAQAAVYVACAPKSNACYLGIDAAINDVRHKDIGMVPLHLKDAHYSGAKDLGRGIEYRYPHDYPHHYVQQDYLPEALRGTVYCHLTEEGYEHKQKVRLTERGVSI